MVPEPKFEVGGVLGFVVLDGVKGGGGFVVEVLGLVVGGGEGSVVGEVVAFGNLVEFEGGVVGGFVGALNF